MKHRGNEESTRLRSTKSRYVVTSLLVCLFIRILAFSLFNVIQGSNYKYINMLINIENMQNEEMKQKDNYIRKGHYTPLEEKSNELEKYFEKNKRNNELRQFIFKNDSMHYSFNSDVYNFKYIYDSYILSKIYKDIYSSLTSFLDNTLINEYKVLFLQPNLGNFWYIFSTVTFHILHRKSDGAKLAHGKLM
ncbi:GPI transamidase subunit PIG-U, putative [Plasmodium malariae]|uniref:GPI transamidase subunit PIG-U, putative n=1 Tax=Plasmodium malariae TaxID=5858 RepID=A0A1A8W529_PLAMA|nr:GPI transamidase subunit PIG-U, putative [Plasmodium malariae]